MANCAGGRLTYEQQEALNEKLYNACKKGHTEEAVQLIADGADVDYEHSVLDRLTVLGITSREGHVDTVQQLLAHNASIEERDACKSTAFLRSCEGGDMQTVKLLYDSGANVKALDEVGHTAVHYGCASGNIELVQFLLLLGLSLQDTDKYGETSIFDACRNGHLEVIKFLMSHRLSIDSQNKKGKTPMDELKKIQGWEDAARKERKKKCLDYLQSNDKGAESSDSLVADTSSTPVEKGDQTSGPSDEQRKNKDMNV